jgi:hypothetical protein
VSTKEKEMKIRTTIGLMLVMMTTLVACSGAGPSASATQAAASGSTASSAQSDASSTGTLSAIAQLAAGTLSLEGSDQAVTADQARTLLPLWQAYRALAQSDTAAPAELEALTAQIRDTMTSAQVEAINKMNLKQADLATLMEKLGLRPAVSADATPGARTFSGNGFAGGFAAGGPPPGAAGGTGFSGFGRSGTGGQFPGALGGTNGEGFLRATPNATALAGRAGRAGERIAVVFINSLITLLEARIGAS